VNSNGEQMQVCLVQPTVIGGQVVLPAGVCSNDVFSYSSISPSGRYVLFSDDLNASSPPSATLVYDRMTGSLQTVAVDKSGGYAGVGGTDLGPDGRLVLFSDCTNRSCQNIHFYLHDEGSAVGTGALASTGRLAVVGTQNFAATDVISGTANQTIDSVLTAAGADLVGASLVYRPQLGDVFVREQLKTMPAVDGTALAGNAGVLYGFDLTANGTHYQVRVQRVPGPCYDSAGGASFGLFRQNLTTGAYSRVATLRGGYGTTGEDVVFALPLGDIGLQTGGQLAGLRAFAALGSFATGALTLVDQVSLIHDGPAWLSW
jgi:hypothetical protein